jgi:L-aspartate oxidase
MFDSISQRRYLLPFKAARLPQQLTDVLVVGGGVAGLRAALEASKSADVLVLTKDSLEQSNTWYAQGGIAAVLQPEDSIALHVSDTESAGAGICDPRAVEIVIREGPARVLELLEWGARFDRKVGNPYDLDFAREGGHSFARIVHAYGDATGKELAQTLINAVQARESIRVSPNSFVLDLITDNGRCVGALAIINNQLHVVWAKRTILASGGAGQLYRETTNPRIATADGHAMAWRAGAILCDMEMVQFHPTTLYVAGSSRALITEAVRGEGAYLVDRNGHRFMPDYHPMAELAPRDVVSRSIVQQIRKTNYTHVYLDVRHLPTDKFRERFPQLAHLMDQFEIDISRDLIPVHPAAHYMIGGVDADEYGRSSLSGLYAVGEVGCSGLHGANRLGSNSLLEGLAFGARAGAHAAAAAAAETAKFPQSLEHRIPRSNKTELDVIDVKSSLRSIMWRNVGIEREAERLNETREIIAFWSRYVMDKVFDPQTLGSATAVAGWELQNMLTVAALIATAAYTRTESRGVHHRLDYPQRDDEHWRVRLLWKRPLETPIPRPVWGEPATRG